MFESARAIALLDGFPVSEGHTLVIPRRHVASVFDLTANEQLELWELVGRTRQLLIAKHGIAGFNIGVNDGTAAGQTVAHAHVHVIPRRSGDVSDPRGGVRWVIPERAAYWK
jgi:diadenosine tetraphosphate (Ap4A) HIT family hydrolase